MLAKLTGLDLWFAGRPDDWLTVALILVAIAALALALWGPPAVKAGALVWMALP